MTLRSMSLAAMLAASALGGAASALAMGNMPDPWQEELKSQLLREQHCEVAFYSRIEARKSDGQEIVFARAHCVDRRAFDASRQSADEPFKLKECGVQAC